MPTLRDGHTATKPHTSVAPSLQVAIDLQRIFASKCHIATFRSVATLAFPAQRQKTRQPGRCGRRLPPSFFGLSAATTLAPLAGGSPFSGSIPFRFASFHTAASPPRNRDGEFGRKQRHSKIVMRSFCFEWSRLKRYGWLHLSAILSKINMMLIADISQKQKTIQRKAGSHIHPPMSWYCLLFFGLSEKNIREDIRKDSN